MTGGGNWSNFEPFVDRHGVPRPLAEAAAVGLISVFFAFGGFWEASRIAGEVKEPQRTMPAALTIGVTCVTAVYVVTTLAFIYLVPVEQVTSATEFAQRAGEAMLGAAGPRTLGVHRRSISKHVVRNKSDVPGRPAYLGGVLRTRGGVSANALIHVA